MPDSGDFHEAQQLHTHRAIFFFASANFTVVHMKAKPP